MARATSRRALARSGWTAFVCLLQVASGNLGGNPGCPCLDFSHQPTPPLTDKICTNNIVMADDNCVPLDFGAHRCDYHDARLSYCNGTTDGWCQEQWCYVNATQCHASKERYWKSSLYGPSVDIYYSYTTCGGDETQWIAVNALAGLKNKRIRAAIPKLYYPGHYHEDPVTGAAVSIANATEAQLTTNLRGFWIDYFNNMATLGEFDIEWRSVSMASRTAYPSAWTACTRDVQRGVLDVCIGNFWTTEARLQMANFLTSASIENFHLLVRRPGEDKSFASRASLAYKPFTPELWAMIIVCMLLMGVAYTITSNTERRLPPTKSYIYNTYVSSVELFGASVAIDDKDKQVAPSILFLKVAWAFFILAIAGGYVANLAAQLSAQNMAIAPLNTLNDCILQSCTLCVHGAQKPLMDTVYGNRLTTKVVAYSGASLVAHVIDPASGTTAPGQVCDAYLISTDAASSFFQGELCDWKFVGAMVNWFGIAQPVINYTTSKVLSILQQKLVADNYYRTTRDKYLPARTCNMFVDSASGSSAAADPIELSHFFGPLVLLGAAGFFAVVSKLLRKGTSAAQNMKRSRRWSRVAAAAVVVGQAKAPIVVLNERGRDAPGGVGDAPGGGAADGERPTPAKLPPLTTSAVVQAFKVPN